MAILYFSYFYQFFRKKSAFIIALSQCVISTFHVLNDFKLILCSLPDYCLIILLRNSHGEFLKYFAVFCFMLIFSEFLFFENFLKLE